MDYLELLEYSYKTEIAHSGETSRLDYLSENIFDFTLYDSEMGDLFGKKAVEICCAINDKKSFEYQKDSYQWYLIIVNMPLFVGKLEWGMSIRGAWWGLYGDDVFTIESCGLWQNDDQLLALKFNAEEWGLFIRALKSFTS